jgi:peptidoglycan/xylan/chitin deacetylase (PgdA/CDA1 family)
MRKLAAWILAVSLAATLSGCAPTPSASSSAPASPGAATATPSSAADDPTPAPSGTSISGLGVKIPILYYHAIADETFGIEQMFVRIQEFDDQMRYMKDNGYQCVTFDDLDHLRDFKKPFMITFDDGYEDNYTNMYPILKKYGFKATVFLVPLYVDKNRYLKTSEILEMRELVNFQSHTLTHDYLTTLSYEEIERQLRDSKSQIEALTGQIVTAIAYPVGDYDDRVLEIAARYYRYGLLMGGGLYYHTGEDLLRMNRVYIPRGLDIADFKFKIEAE